MKREHLVTLSVVAVAFLSLMKIYGHQSESVTAISRLPLEGAIKPASKSNSARTQKSGMPLVHVTPPQSASLNSVIVSDDAFSMPTIITEQVIQAPPPPPEPLPEPEVAASPWDAIANNQISIGMISTIQGRRYAVINGGMVKSGDKVNLNIGEGRAISIKVNRIRSDDVTLSLDSVAKRFTL